MAGLTVKIISQALRLQRLNETKECCRHFLVLREHLYHFYPVEQLGQGRLDRPAYYTMPGVVEDRFSCQYVSLGGKLRAKVVTSGIIPTPYGIELGTAHRRQCTKLEQLVSCHGASLALCNLLFSYHAAISGTQALACGHIISHNTLISSCASSFALRSMKWRNERREKLTTKCWR